VLADLLVAIGVNGAVGIDTTLLLEHYRNVQLALVRAVREVHVKLNRVPLATRKIIGDTMEQFEWVFTTSYDLLAYWAMAAAGFEPFMDHFRYRGRCEFDPLGPACRRTGFRSTFSTEPCIWSQVAPAQPGSCGKRIWTAFSANSESR
jgi:hypothetical protein